MLRLEKSTSTASFSLPHTNQTLPLGGSLMPYLLISHEFDSRFWSDLQDVDAVAAPKGPGPTFSDHMGKASDDAHVVAARSVDLKETDHLGVGWTLAHEFSSVSRQHPFNLS